MSDNPSVHFIPAKPVKREKRVGIYRCVSSNSADQLKSPYSTSISIDNNDSCCTSMASC